VTADETGTEPAAVGERRGNVAIVRLNRPRALNSVAADLAGVVGTLLAEAAADPEVRVVVPTGTGRAFCAGADPKSIAAGVSIEAPGHPRTVRRGGRRASATAPDPPETGRGAGADRAPLTAAQAQDLGLVNRVVAPASTALDVALEIAELIAANAPIAVQEPKSLLHRAAHLSSWEPGCGSSTRPRECGCSTARTRGRGPRAFAGKGPPV
jgi:enoyl-CoA hydratase/carnithine racemase